MRDKVFLIILIMSLSILSALHYEGSFYSEEADRTYKGYYSVGISFDSPGIYTLLLSIEQDGSIGSYTISVQRNVSMYYPSFEEVSYGYEEIVEMNLYTSDNKITKAIQVIVDVPGNYALFVRGDSLHDAKVDVKVYKFGEPTKSLSPGTNELKINESIGSVFEFAPDEDGVYELSFNQTAYKAPYFVHFLALKTSSSYSYGYYYYDVYLNGKKIGRYFTYLDSEYPVIISCLLYTSPSPRDLSTSRMPSSA